MRTTPRRLTGHFVVLLATCYLASACSEPDQPNSHNGASLRDANPETVLNQIVAEREKCIDPGDFISRSEQQRCDLMGVEATYSILARSPSNKAFDTMLSDLQNPMRLHLTNGSNESPLALRVVYTGGAFDLAVERAAILTGARIRLPEAEVKAPTELFSWLLPFTEARPFKDRWNALRDADCRVYRVESCAARLDDAVRKAFDLEPDPSYLHGSDF